MSDLSHIIPSIDLGLTASQSSIKKKPVTRVESKDTQKTGLQASPDKSGDARGVPLKSHSAGQQLYKPLFNWKKTDGNHRFYIEANENHSASTLVLPSTEPTKHTIRLFGYPVDISRHLHLFKQKLQTLFIESKSHNRLVGSFYQLKFGFISTLLSTLGVPPSEIESLKKTALNQAIQHNKDNFSQNEYNIELLTIFQNEKKDTSRIKILLTVRRQLNQQMALYGNPDYYTSAHLYAIKKKQIRKIQDELLEERQNLTYIRSFS